jgi:putative flavoprotein involved in K+ transport
LSDQHLGTVVIGGSQAGLAVGYTLRQRGLPFVILDENDRIGDAWRRRWDSLRLFTPGRYESCPGLYFVGLPFLYSLSSALLGGVGRDAKYIVDHIVSMRPARMG